MSRFQRQVKYDPKFWKLALRIGLSSLFYQMQTLKRSASYRHRWVNPATIYLPCALFLARSPLSYLIPEGLISPEFYPHPLFRPQTPPGAVARAYTTQHLPDHQGPSLPLEHHTWKAASRACFKSKILSCSLSKQHSRHSRRRNPRVITSLLSSHHTVLSAPTLPNFSHTALGKFESRYFWIAASYRLHFPAPLHLDRAMRQLLVNGT